MAEIILHWEHFGTFKQLKEGKLDDKKLGKTKPAIYMFNCFKRLSDGKLHVYSGNPKYIGKSFDRPVIERLKEHLNDEVGKCLKKYCKQELQIKVARIEFPLKLSYIFLHSERDIVDVAECCLIFQEKPVCNTVCKDEYTKNFDITVHNKGDKKPLKKRICRCKAKEN